MKRSRRILAVGAVLIAILVAAVAFTQSGKESAVSVFQDKADLLYKQVENINGQDVYVVFLSVCNGEYRANVYTGRGDSIKSAWTNASNQVIAFLKNSKLEPRWVKCDVVSYSEIITYDELCSDLAASYSGYYRYGLAFDTRFQTALLEQELNYTGIYDYDEDSIDLDYLNLYLTAAGRPVLNSMSDNLIRFRCEGWVCDDDNQVYELGTDALNYGRRVVDKITKEYAEDLITRAGNYLRKQVKQDGRFVYGVYANFGYEIDEYVIMRHIGTIWSLIQYYQLTGDLTVQEEIDSLISYMLEQVVNQDDKAYILDEDNELALGSNGLAVVVLTEYMRAFDSDKYFDICIKLGNGILSFMNPETGEYSFIFDRDFRDVTQERLAYYEGEATFGLCLLHELTGDIQYLNAIKKSVDYFIANDYVKCYDHWMMYAMREVCKVFPDNQEYYDFAFACCMSDLDNRVATYEVAPASLESMLAVFDIYNQAVDVDIIDIPDWFDISKLINGIETRVDKDLNGWCFPEVAMYLHSPSDILDAHMIRSVQYMARVDNVQHVIGAYYQYVQEYEKFAELRA